MIRSKIRRLNRLTGADVTVVYENRRQQEDFYVVYAGSKWLASDQNLAVALSDAHKEARRRIFKDGEV